MTRRVSFPTVSGHQQRNESLQSRFPRRDRTDNPTHSPRASRSRNPDRRARLAPPNSLPSHVRPSFAKTMPRGTRIRVQYHNILPTLHLEDIWHETATVSLRSLLPNRQLDDRADRMTAKMAVPRTEDRHDPYAGRFPGARSTGFDEDSTAGAGPISARAGQPA